MLDHYLYQRILPLAESQLKGEIEQYETALEGKHQGAKSNVFVFTNLIAR